MLDQQNGAPVLANTVYQFAQLYFFCSVHAGRRFVQRHQLRVCRQGTRDFKPSLIAVTECARFVISQF